MNISINKDYLQFKVCLLNSLNYFYNLKKESNDRGTAA